MMIKIDLKSAYDEFTQESLFLDVCKENIMDAQEWDPLQVEIAQKDFGAWQDIEHLSQDLLKMYQEHWADIAATIDDRIAFYVTIDYSQMLQDDLFTGYFDLVKCDDGTFTILMTNEGQTRSNLTKILN